jgi:hypothetical protein
MEWLFPTLAYVLVFALVATGIETLKAGLPAVRANRAAIVPLSVIVLLAWGFAATVFLFYLVVHSQPTGSVAAG